MSLLMDPVLVFATPNITKTDIDNISQYLLKEESIVMSSEIETLLNVAQSDEEDNICCFNDAVCYLMNDNILPFDTIWVDEDDILVLTPNYKYNNDLSISFYGGEYLNQTLGFNTKDTSKTALKEFVEFLEECNLGHLYDEMDWLFVSYY